MKETIQEERKNNVDVKELFDELIYKIDNMKSNLSG